ncbi:MAG: type II toxin-antitoxin system mRNA interferase toxin, RelE/StbE family [Brevinematales bacterium]|nr:type II toxin-antitoxin system mRNA interferase toxin, RelE/StbE family [Brevinematales bacterium]
MIQFIWDSAFKRRYKKVIETHPEWKDRFTESVILFSENPYHKKLKTHKLSGKLKGLWAFSVDYDCRVVFEFIKEDTVLLIDIGSHDDVY